LTAGGGSVQVPPPVVVGGGLVQVPLLAGIALSQALAVQVPQPALQGCPGVAQVLSVRMLQ